MYAHGPNGGIVQNFGNLDEVIFLQVSLSENVNLPFSRFHEAIANVL